MMNRLQHPKIIQLYDAYEYNKMVCVVLELWEIKINFSPSAANLYRKNFLFLSQNWWRWTFRSRIGW
jgi:hypothetical protein